MNSSCNCLFYILNLRQDFKMSLCDSLLGQLGLVEKRYNDIHMNQEFLII